MSVLGWRMEPRIVGRQAGSLTRIWRVSPQRRPPTSCINGPLLPGLAVHIVGIAEGWAVEGKKQYEQYTLVVELKLMMLYHYSSQRKCIYRLIYLLCRQRIESYLTSWRPQRDGHKNWPRWDCSESWQRPPGSWGMYGSQSVGRRWHQTAERWTELSFCSASAWSEVWRTSSLQGGRWGGEGKGQQEHEGQSLNIWRRFLFIFQ